MDDDFRSALEAAAAIEQDITYLKAATGQPCRKRTAIPLGLEQEIIELNAVLGIYPANSANGVVFP